MPSSSQNKAAIPMKIFFSYGHDANQELVDMLRADLEKRGHEVWFDSKKIGLWTDWREKITQGIHESQLCVAFLSHHALRDSGVCRNEIALAVHRFGELQPAEVEALPNEEIIPPVIRHIATIDLSLWQKIRAGEIPDMDWNRWYQKHLIELIHAIEGADGIGRRSADNAALREVLAPTSFDSQLAQHIEGFVGRNWVFDEYKNWLQQNDSRLFWLKAGPGVGKTAIAAQLAIRERDSVVGNWFINAYSAELRNPRNAISTLAFQFALRWPKYRERLLLALGLTVHTPAEQREQIRKELGLLDSAALFKRLIADPLGKIDAPATSAVIVIDALDEAADEQGGNPLTDFLVEQMASLPAWLRLVVTSRPEQNVIARLQGFAPFSIDGQDPRNQQDILQWYDTNLATLPVLAALPQPEKTRLRSLVAECSEGMMLYLKLVRDGLQEQVLTVAELERMQKGLGGLYENYGNIFGHRFHADYDKAMRPLLCLLVGAAGPLPADLMAQALGWQLEQVQAGIQRLGSYVVQSTLGLELFHKTLREWLLLPPDDNAYAVDASLGKQQLADAMFAQFRAGEDAFNMPWRDTIAQQLPVILPFVRQSNEPEALSNLGLQLVYMGDYEEAESWLRESIDLFRDSQPVNGLGLAHAYSNLADVLGVRVQSDPSLIPEVKSCRLAASIYFELAPSPLDQVGMARNLRGFADLYINEGMIQDAKKDYAKALEYLNKVVPPSKESRVNIAGIYNCQAALLKREKDFKGAEKLYREALAVVKATQPEDHPDIAASLNNLAALLMETAHHEEAVDLYRQVLAMLQKSLPPKHPHIAAAQINLANLWLTTKRYQDAEPLYRQALAILQTALPAGHPNIAICLNSLAALLQTIGRYEEAEPLYRKALAIRQAALPADHLDIYTSKENLLACLRRAGRNNEAEILEEKYEKEWLASRKKLMVIQDGKPEA